MRRFASSPVALSVALCASLACRKADKEPPAATPAPAPAEEQAAAAPVELEPAPARKDGDIYWEMIAPHFDRVSVYDGVQAFETEWRKTPEPARHLLTAHWVVMEISNGGFQQLFSTAGGLLVPEGIVGLRALGLEENARMLEQAAAALGKPYPRDRKVRERRLKAYQRRSGQDNPFAELDGQFFEALKKYPGGFDGVAARYAQAGAQPGE